MSAFKASVLAALLVAGTAVAQDKPGWDRGDFMKSCMKSATDAKVDYSRGEAICSCAAARIEQRVAEARAGGTAGADFQPLPSGERLVDMLRDCSRPG